MSGVSLEGEGIEDAATYDAVVRELSCAQDKLSRAEDELARAREREASLRRQFEALLLAYERLKRQLFGQKAERLNPDQLALAWQAAQNELGIPANEQSSFPEMGALSATDMPEPKNPTGPAGAGRLGGKKRTPHKHGRRKLEDADLPEEVIVLSPPDIPEGAQRVDEEVTYKLEYRRAGMVRLKVVRPIYRLPWQDDAPRVQAPPPCKMIPRGMLAPGLLAHILVSKWADHHSVFWAVSQARENPGA